VPEARAVVRALGFVGDDRALVDALRKGHPGAPTALFDRYGGHVQRVLARVLGVDPDLGDLLHDVFVEALGSIGAVRDGSSLKAWLTQIAVFKARGCIRRRRRRAWLRLFSSLEREPDMPAPAVAPEVLEALRSTYRVLEQLPADERIAFALRHIDGMELTEVASACGVSLATVKRKLARAREAFVRAAREQGALSDWLEGGPR
jgi:RNA polymerase sigma-70 factor (ECF subfamily)